jgi:hypothetical protein
MATKPAKRKATAKKTAPRRPARSKAPVEPVIIAPAPAPAPQESGLKRKVITWGIVAAIAFYAWGPTCKRKASDPAAAAAAPASAPVPQGASAELRASWGPKFSLKEVSSFKAPGPIQAIAVDANGTVFACTYTDLFQFKDGKQVKQVALGGGSYRNIGLHGDQVLVTYSDGASVAIFNRNLEYKGAFTVQGGRRTLSMAVLGKNQLAFCEVDGDKVYFSDIKGRAKAQPGIIEKGESIGMVYDMQAVGQTLYMNNVYGGGVRKWENGKAKPFYKTPCSNPSNMRKVAIVDGVNYCGCGEDNVIVKIGADGKYKGYAKFDKPNVLVGGQDGFLYAHDGGELFKLEPPK